jgi:predicted Zn-dependent peptidase
MSSRLFTEVREKRGLVYHVSTRYHSLKDHAAFFTYAGTTPEKAQETFDVTIGELRRLAEGIAPQEMEIARTQLKSALIMHGESTTSRANALVSDWYHLERLRTLKELSEAIDKVTVDDVLEYLSEYPAADFTLLVIGPEPVETGAMNE